MKIVIVDTYYPAFLKSCYRQTKGLCRRSYKEQLGFLLGKCFGTSDFYSRHLKAMGCRVDDLIVNCAPLQTAWAHEDGRRLNTNFLGIPPRCYRAPLLGQLLTKLPGFLDIAVAQIRELKPEILYIQDLSFFPPMVLKKLREEIPLVVGQIACPLPPVAFLENYDLILTSFPHFVPRLLELGVSSEYFRIAFDPHVLERIGPVKKDVDLSFVGGISRHHGNAVPNLEYLAHHTPIQFYGYGAKKLKRKSPIISRHHGEVWGLDMYRALARSRITVNRHINVAENNANNMRLYEATGVGSLLITDRKDNLSELFDIGKEVLEYSNPQEAVALIRYYLAHPEEGNDIARAGQRRTLKDHTYKNRMIELVNILRRHLEASN